MGRPKKELTFYDAIEIFRKAEGNMLTHRELYRMVNGNRKPKEFAILLAMMHASGWFGFIKEGHTGPRSGTGQKMIWYYPEKQAATEAAEREAASTSPIVPLTPEPQS